MGGKHMKKRYRLIAISYLLLLLFGGIWMVGKMKESDVKQSDVKYSIFSWSREEVTNHREQFVEDLVAYQFNRVFQSFSSELSKEEISSFLSALSEQEIDVYSLTGTPEWALDPKGSSMIKRLEWIVEMNESLPEQQQIKGLVIDVEPYTLDEFDWKNREVQKAFISSMTKLYEASEKENLELIIVIPYFFDSKGYQEVATKFIREISDEVAVMNYHRNREIKNLTFEAREASQAAKPLTTIYEFKRPGKHGLHDRNTYFNVGWLAAKENMDQLIQHYKDQTIHIAIHDYRAFQEVIHRE